MSQKDKTKQTEKIEVFYFVFFVFWLAALFLSAGSVFGANYKKVATEIGAGCLEYSSLVTLDGKKLFLPHNKKELEFAAADCGNICGSAVIARSNDKKHPVIVAAGNGCGSANGSASVQIFDGKTGEILAKFTCGNLPYNGICSVTLVDLDGNGTADSGYAGDLRGNLWKFFLHGKKCQSWSHGEKPIFTASYGGRPQPIVAAATVFRHCSQKGVLVSFGTGKFPSEPHFAFVNSLYTIWDNAAKKKQWILGRFDAQNGVFSFPSGTQFSENVTLLRQKVEDKDGIRRATAFSPNWWEKRSAGSSKNFHLGWFVNLPGHYAEGGEIIDKKPLLKAGILFVASFLPASGTKPEKSVIFSLRSCTGGVFRNPVLVLPKSEVEKDKTGDEIFSAGKIVDGRVQKIAIIKKDGNNIVQLERKDGAKDNLPLQKKALREGVFFWQELE